MKTLLTAVTLDISFSTVVPLAVMQTVVSVFPRSNIHILLYRPLLYIIRHSKRRFTFKLPQNKVKYLGILQKTSPF